MNKKEYDKKWRKNHHESVIQYNKKWRKNHPNYYPNQSKIFRSLKINGCAICGYNKCTDSLDFHHVNSKDKNFRVNTHTFKKRGMKIFIEEVNKCILLCKNCHYEIHQNEREE